MASIKLEGMSFYSHHGYYTEERKRGNNYVMDVEIGYDMVQAAQTDELEHAINYEEVYAICVEEMDAAKHLIETVAYRIVSRIMNSFETAQSARVILRKLKPELGGAVANSTVDYTQHRNTPAG